MKCKAFSREKFMVTQMGWSSGLFLPSVYDAMLLLRPSLNFRDGRAIKNYTRDLREYFIQLPFNDAYKWAVLHLVPADYRSQLDMGVHRTCGDSRPSAGGAASSSLGFASLFLLVKSYVLVPRIKAPKAFLAR
jgi:hypothetical protein